MHNNTFEHEELFEHKEYSRIKKLIAKNHINLNSIPRMEIDHDPMREPIVKRYYHIAKIMLCLGANPNLRSPCWEHLIFTTDIVMRTPLEDILCRTRNGLFVNDKHISLLIANGAQLRRPCEFNWINFYIVKVREIRHIARIILALKRRRLTVMRNLDRFLIHELAICVFAERYQKC